MTLSYSLDQTIPLEKIQDVELQEGCWETCFSLKNVQVQTAGFCDVQTGSLAHPEVAREAILLAAKQYRDRLTLAPAGTVKFASFFVLVSLVRA